MSRNVTELFSLLTNVDKTSKVLDICAGTGGFLIVAMHQVFKSTVTEAEKTEIKKNGLVGVAQPNMFALCREQYAASGGAGKRIYISLPASMRRLSIASKLTVAMSAYESSSSQVDEELRELYFVKQMLDCLGGYCTNFLRYLAP